MVNTGFELTECQGATVLLTGGTGFLGKVVLEQLLRERCVENIFHIILVIRPREGASATQRFASEVRGSLCFSRLSPDWEKYLKVLAADLSLPQWGLSDSEWQGLAEKVTHVIHTAASVEFNLPLAEAARANITASLEVTRFAARCPRLKSFVCVSTAYVHPHSSRPLGEHLVPLPWDPETMYTRIQRGDIDQAALLAETGHPNTYTLTKCLAEHLIAQTAKGLPLTIVRPSIISAAWQYPFPGWIDSFAALGGFVAAYGAGLLRVVAADPEARLDVVPVDRVSDAIIRASLGGKSLPHRLEMLQVVAGLERALKIASIRSALTSYFETYPAERKPHFKRVRPLTSRLKVAHAVFNQAPLSLAQGLALARGKKKTAHRMRKLRNVIHGTFSDFTYFTHNSFDFRTDQKDAWDGDQKVFLHLICQGVHQHLLRGTPERQVLFSSLSTPQSSPQKVLFGLSPRNLPSTLYTRTLKPLLASLFDEISVDLASFQRALLQRAEDMRLVIAPTYRSYMDLLVSLYVCAAYPELGMGMARLAPPSDLRILNRFLSRRKILAGDDPFILFVEDKRSHSRTFQEPQTHLLQSLQASHEKSLILPVAIAYDRIFEESEYLSVLRGDVNTHRDHPQKILQILGRFVKKNDKLGTVHVRCAAPVVLGPEDKVEETAQVLSGRLRQAMAVSDYHLECYIQANPRLGLTTEMIVQQLKRLGVPVVSSPLRGCTPPILDPYLEQTFREQWMHHLP